jgi:hypothetical protein
MSCCSEVFGSRWGSQALLILPLTRVVDHHGRKPFVARVQEVKARVPKVRKGVSRGLEYS